MRKFFIKLANGLKTFFYWIGRGLLAIWQLPQNIVGFLVAAPWSENTEKTTVVDEEKGTKITVFARNLFRSGVSLGDFIIVDKVNLFSEIPSKVEDAITTVKHEHGHQLQSKIHGPFYLITVGLPSLIRNIWDRLFHKEWSYERRKKWYYSGYPEADADIFGGVVRWTDDE